MEKILNFNDFLTEKKVVVKRKYTEEYPAKVASTSARVRNAILDAIGDGVITEEEMENILSEIEAHKRWRSRNSKLFKRVREDGESKICLSKYGKRIRNRTLKNESPDNISEALNIPHKERGRIPVNIFVGRFQPFTLGHIKAFKKIHKENKLPIVLFIVRGKNADKERNPFDKELQQSLFASMIKEYDFLESSYVIDSASIDKIFSLLRPTYEPILWGYGTDRKTGYEYQINKEQYRSDLNVDPNFRGFEVIRGDKDVSSTKVRNAIKVDNEPLFKKLTPKSIHSFYITLQNELEKNAS